MVFLYQLKTKEVKHGKKISIPGSVQTRSRCEKEAWVDITKTPALALENLIKKLPKGRVVEWKRNRVKIRWE